MKKLVLTKQGKLKAYTRNRYHSANAQVIAK